LARIHRKLHIDKVSPILKAALKDKNEYVRGQSENTKDDIGFLLKVKI
jgi:3-methyladenine DNA glycosylase AlkC